MKIDLLPALNGDSVLVEYVPSHYFLIDGGYVDTYKDYLLPKLKEISENGGAIDVIVVTHIDADHISGIIKLLGRGSSYINRRNLVQWISAYSVCC